MDGIPVLPGVLRVMVPDAVAAGIIKQPSAVMKTIHPSIKALPL